MDILTIGNSFSQDITTYLQRITNKDIYVRNIYIPGCSLEQHANNILNDNKTYEYQKDGRKLYMTSLKEALYKRQWDIITLQQVSHLSGIESSYHPFLVALIQYIEEKCPNAKLMFIKTWPYEKGCSHSGFQNYDNNTVTMYKAITNAVENTSKRYSLEIIDVGNTIYNAYVKASNDSDIEKIEYYRDGFHLSIPQGRYLAALAFHNHLYGKDGINLKYKPKKMTKIQQEILLNHI